MKTKSNISTPTSVIIKQKVKTGSIYVYNHMTMKYHEQPVKNSKLVVTEKKNKQ